ncbi:hypothetical protein [Actinomadura litoris]|uniref:Sulfotransferase family protein n=1 Tax=Actinomadura litoris TaxID=2678616 RepID=A0A7K1LC78_9ACTN|nr:hypothetical protein [Actinomadura litoris]MUN42027.1 hypothetical protein [Actinomadura litoris]
MVYLHVGAAKSGTTYLQNVLWHNRERLRGDGLLYPGGDSASHVRAAFDLRETFFGGAADLSVRGAWPALVEEARAWHGDVILSQELFAPATQEEVARALADLGFLDVHVVFTARDLARQIPAHWQEDVKNRFTTSFPDFVAALRHRNWQGIDSARLFWGLQDPVAVLERWGASLPPDRVHVVTLPRPGAPRDLLWRRFCAAVGLVPDGYDLAVPYTNPSLGLAETEFLRLLNGALDDGLGWPAYNDVVKHYLAQDVLTARPDPVRIRLPAGDLPWATERAIETAEGLRAAGYHVVGDLYELVPVEGAAEAESAEPPPADLADVAVDAAAALLLRVREREGRAEGTPPARDQIDRLRGEAAELADRTGRLAHGALPLVHRAARNAAERYPAVRRVGGAYRRIQDRR